MNREYVRAMKTCSGLEPIERACATATTPSELLATVSAEFRRQVPHDGAIWTAMDPETMLSTTPSRTDALDNALWKTFWDLESFEQDIGLFVDLARNGRPTAMRLELGERIGRSPRYREFMCPQGFGDELRGVFRSGSSAWGAVGLYRDRSRPAFTATDLEFVRATSGTIACALRSHARAAAPSVPRPAGPGLIVVDGTGAVTLANEDAVTWLRTLWPIGLPKSPAGVVSFNVFDLRDRQRGVPTPLYALVARARAVAGGREFAPAQLRLRDGRGRWLMLHASAVRGSVSSAAGVAVIMQAAKRSDIAPIVMDAYSLTLREREVIEAAARGSSTQEIASQLYMSPHTVRDHLKTVFEKVGVSSRAELVATLFGQH